jgi:deoxycytidine triphosphate deaminase
MPVPSDTQIRELVSIEPFAGNEKRHGVVGYGVSSHGYDARVGAKFGIDATEGTAQSVFLKSDRVCAVRYAHKNGKYQHRPRLTLAMADGLAEANARTSTSSPALQRSSSH